MFLVGREATHAQTRQHHHRLEIVSHPMPLSVVQRGKNHMVINPDHKVDVEELPMHFFEDICSQLGSMKSDVIVQQNDTPD
jgi:hypothetical protein